MTAPLTNEQLLAAQYIESIYDVASSTGNTKNLNLWIDPDNNSKPYYVYLRDSILNGAKYPTPLKGNLVDAQRQYYRRTTNVLMSTVERAALTWARANLIKQGINLEHLLQDVDLLAKVLHLEAVKIQRQALDIFKFTSMTEAELLVVTGKSGVSGTMVTRFKRVAYMRTVRNSGNKYLFYLMAHPRGVQIIDAFATSAKEGQELVAKTINECITAIDTVLTHLMIDEKSGHCSFIWHFPPAISAGVATLGLANSQALTRFSLGWASVWGGHGIDSVLENTGNAIFVLDLVGGELGIAVGMVLDFVLGVIGTTVSFIHDLEQDQAAEATIFADDSEKLSKGANSLGTILKGVTTIVAAVALPSTIAKITRTVSKGKNVATAVERLSQMRNTSEEVRSISQKSKPILLENKSISTSSKLTSQENKSIISAAKGIDLADIVIGNINVENAIKDSLSKHGLGNVRIDVHAIEETLREGGAEITQNKIDRISRDLNTFLAEEGQIKAQKLVGYLPENVIDKGVRGKKLEASFQTFGKDLHNLNALTKGGNNFPVVDFVLGEKLTGPIISNATGSKSRLLDKIQELFDINIVNGQIVRASGPTTKFNQALKLLVDNGYLPSAHTYEAFIIRSKLFVPAQSVDPLKIFIRMNVDSSSPQRELLLRAIISGI